MQKYSIFKMKNTRTQIAKVFFMTEK